MLRESYENERAEELAAACAAVGAALPLVIVIRVRASNLGRKLRRRSWTTADPRRGSRRHLLQRLDRPRLPRNRRGYGDHAYERHAGRHGKGGRSGSLLCQRCKLGRTP